MATPKKQFAPELLAEARRLYEQTLAPVSDIMAMLDLPCSSFYKRVNEWGWRKRHARIGTFQFARALTGTGLAAIMPAPAPADLPRAEIVGQGDPISPQQRDAMAQHLLSAAQDAIGAVKRILAKVEPANQVENEHCARTIANVSRSLREIDALINPDPVTPPDEPDDDATPIDIDEFRNELARRIRGLIGKHRDDAAEGAVGTVARIDAPRT